MHLREGPTDDNKAPLPIYHAHATDTSVQPKGQAAYHLTVVGHNAINARTVDLREAAAQENPAFRDNKSADGGANVQSCHVNRWRQVHGARARA